MLKIKNKFLYFVVLFIIIVIWIAVYIAVFQRWVDRSSYVELIEWTAKLNDEDLNKNERKKLEIDDIITTTSEYAITIIEWWDGSVTRLGGNTSVQINNLFVSQDKSKLNISFELFKWKTWSNVLSFITEDSYFIQSFMDVEAAVRWTIFNVDLENDYIYVLKHKIELLRENWDEIEIKENKPFDLKTFSFLKLEEFIKSVKDNAFESINRALDAELYLLLKANIEENIEAFLVFTKDSVDKISSPTKREEMYKEILSKYQELNFVGSDYEALYEKKIELKEMLLNLAPDEWKQVWLDSFLLDFEEAVTAKSQNVVKKIVDIFVENESKLSDSAVELLEEYIDKIPPELKDAFLDNFNILKDIFSFEFK